jgi:hypothetical protein
LNTKPRFTFKANYSVNSEVDLPPAGERVVAFAPEGNNPNIGLDGGVLCVISPDGHKDWMASFKSGYRSPGFVHGIFSTPNPEIVSSLQAVVDIGSMYSSRQNQIFNALPYGR